MIPREMVTLMERRRLVAEVRTETALQALGVVDALAAAGISTIEISLTIPGAHEILTHCAVRRDVLVGAGAVLDSRQATEAISCGARFIASPILEPDLIPICRDANVACILGALTPTEIIAAQRAGAEMVKVFPAEALGGPMYVRALLRQLTHVSLQVSGGFTAENTSEYLQLPIRTLALGTLLVPRVLVERGNWQAITNRARVFVEFAANPQANAARFLAMVGVAAQPPQPPVYAAPVAIPGNAPGNLVVPPPVPDYAPPPPLPPDAARVAAVPTMAIPPKRERGSGSLDPAASSSGFKPWDSRPVELGDDEDWLR